MSVREESSERIAEKPHSCWCQELLQAEIVGNQECMREEVSHTLILSLTTVLSFVILNAHS